jgi:hypothetical protein
LAISQLSHLEYNLLLKQDFGIGRPRIAVLSLNPHAGDDGLLGKEEQEIISPALQEMNDEGVICYGPYAADGFMGSENYMRFDGILAMYHDQGLAPFKALAMDFFLGLGAAETADTPEALAATALTLLERPERLAAMSAAERTGETRTPAEIIYETLFPGAGFAARDRAEAADTERYTRVR